MRRRFGRRRRGADEAKSLDVSRELSRVVEQENAPVTEIRAVAEDEVPSTVSAVGIGTERDGSPCVVAVSPDSGSAAWLGGVSVGLRLAQEESFSGRVWVLSPHWRSPSRVLLQALTGAPFEVRALAPGVEWAEGQGARVDAETGTAVALSVALAGSPGATSPDPSSFGARAAEALRGLAAKHGGILQREGPSLRLVLMGQPVATLHPSELEIIRPRRDRVGLSGEALSEAFDQLEGSLRKVLSDRKNRDGEPGLRARLVGRFCEALSLGTPALWPIGWGDHCPIDALGVATDGRAVAVALREELGLGALLPIVEAAALLAPVASWLLPAARPEGAGLPVRLAVAAQGIDAGATRVLQALAPQGAVYDLETERGSAAFRLREVTEFTAASPSTRVEKPPTEAAAVVVEAARTAPTSPPSTAAGEGEKPGDDRAEKKPARRFEEMSLFDLSDEEDALGDGGSRRRRRRGGRGRNRNGGDTRGRGDEGSEGQSRGESAAESTEPAPEATEEPERTRRPRRRRRRRRARPLMVEDVAEEELEEEEEESTARETLESGAEPGDEAEDDSDDGETGDDDVDALQEDAAALETPAVAPVEDKPQRPVRRRAAIVAHADPISVGAAVLLARDLRLVDGIWVYQQSELMTFFRSVATDIREGTGLYLIGFTASPTRETLQTASLYGDRITWFDHHDWPPEDVEAMRQAIGADGVHIVPGAGSSLPLVAAQCTRRSRFSDKFLDLLTGRFSPHDYERWGRLWWWRLGEVANQTGDRRRDLDPLLSGRPSDLAREAAKQEPPPLPAEAEYVASHDIPLVHFGGYTLLRLQVPGPLDLTLTARIARERYNAQLVVAAHEGDRAVVLMGDDSNNRRSFDLAAMAEHLASKFSWVEVLPGADHVTRIRVADLLERPERLDEIVTEMAMGRSVLEG